MIKHYIRDPTLHNQDQISHGETVYMREEAKRGEGKKEGREDREEWRRRGEEKGRMSIQEQGRKSVDVCSDRMACMLHYPLV